jgi:ankyrin repeat protein
MDLFQAIANQNLDQIAQLLANGANPNILRPDFPQWTPLHQAINELEDGGTIEALVLLLRYGADVDGWDAHHDATPLLMALFRGQIEVVRLLLAAGADPNVVGSEGDTPLRWCVELGDYETATMLMCCGATKTIDYAGGASGSTALGIAAKRLDLKMIELLLQAGANPQAEDIDKFTAYRRLPPRNEAKDDAVWLAAEALLRPEQSYTEKDC